MNTKDPVRDLDVLCFGEALVDFFPSVTGVPLSDIDVFHRHLGGAPCNVAVGLARLGARVGLMTLVGPDEFGRFVKKRLAAEGVDVAGVGTHASAKTGVTFVSVGASGERSFLFFRHPSADQAIAVADVDVAVVRRARVLHVGSSTLSREPARAATWKAVTEARTSGALISTDPNLRLHLWERREDAIALTRELLTLAHVVKVSDDELELLVGTDNVERGAERLLAMGPSLALVTSGARGSYFRHTGGAAGHVAPRVVATVDATGAGDAFVAGLWAHLLPALDGRSMAALDEPTLRAACEAGNALGAAATTALGATTAVRP